LGSLEQKVGFAYQKILMTQLDPSQPQIQIGLRDQGSILYQLYDLFITTARSHEELERMWEALAHEDEIVIAKRQRRQQ
jgi:hypothetical protein